MTRQVSRHTTSQQKENEPLRVSRLVKLVVPLIFVAGLVGYFGERHFADRGGKFTALSLQGTTREYRAEAASLRLAPGWTWPRAPVRRTAVDGRAVRYERGWGTQAADYYWYCSWASRATDPRVGTAERRSALEQVLAIRDKYFFKTALAAVSRPAFDRVLEQAERGDVRGLRRDYELNCPRAHA
jgi:hypothetical protein